MKREQKKRWISIIAIVLAALMVLGSVSSVFFLSASASNLNSMLEAAQKEKAAAQKQLNEAKTSRTNANAEKERLEGEISDVQGDISDIQAKIDESNAKIEAKTQELDAAQQKADEQYETFKTRARVMYESGSTSYLEVLLGSSSFSDFISNIEIVKDIMAYDQKVFNERIEAAKVVEAAKAEIEAEKQTQEIYYQTLSEKRSTLQAKLDQQKVEVAKYDSAVRQYEQEVAAAEREANRIQSQINAAVQQQAGSGAPAGVTGTGQFTWPAPSSRNVTSEFGSRLHPVYNTVKNHYGLDIGVPIGSTVVAADSGQVLIAGASSSYGNYVVISHGNGLTTLYAHNSQLLVKAGDNVSRGQTIAKSGNTGVTSGPHLHFEVSKNGTRVNPRNYL